MNVKTAFRLTFDLPVLVVMILLYNKRAISMAFHEIAGLVLFAFFVIHLLINRRWFTAITAPRHALAVHATVPVPVRKPSVNGTTHQGHLP